VTGMFGRVIFQIKSIVVTALVLTGWLVVLSSDGVNAYVMGRDDRHAVSEEEARLPEIAQTGVIEIQDGGYVTGILTGDNCDVVLSAGHAAFYWRDNPAKGQSKGTLRVGGKFLFGLDPAQRGQGYAITLVKSGLENPANLADDRHDWSIFRLSQPALPGCKQIVFSRNGGNCNGQILMPAYHFDRRDTLLIDRSCAIKDAINHELLVHDCDSKDGSSGAPLYCRDQAAIKLLGINISGVSRKELVDPGVYGKESRQFNYKNHKNFAVTIHGEFLQALEAELQASTRRKLQQQ